MPTYNTLPAFYKHYTTPSEYWAVGVNAVHNKDYHLYIDDHEEYDYPIDGWNYYENPPQAYIDWWISITPPPIEDVLDE